jgi:hypothetical protein
MEILYWILGWYAIGVVCCIFATIYMGYSVTIKDVLIMLGVSVFGILIIYHTLNEIIDDYRIGDGIAKIMDIQVWKGRK